MTPLTYTYIGIIVPPVLGGLIGYVTNKIAIKMLFRPLKKWQVLGVPIPLTPGIIPSKRHELAVNIGDMVGEHLLTSEEIGRTVQQQHFQEHLYSIIADTIEDVIQRDLGAISTLVPEKYEVQVNGAVWAAKQHFVTQLHQYLYSTEFEDKFFSIINSIYKDLTTQDIDTILPGSAREKGYVFLQQWIEKAVNSHDMEQWLDDYTYTRLSGIIKKDESVADILPKTLQDLLLEIVQEKTPDLLKGAAHLIKDSDVQEKIIAAAKKGVESFLQSMGPMAAMVQNFIKIETIEKMIRDYLVEKEDAIVLWLQNEDVQEKLTYLFHERVQHYLNRPISEYINEKTVDIDGLSNTVSKQLYGILREPGSIESIVGMLKDNIELFIQAGSMEVKSCIEQIFGEKSSDRIELWLREKGLEQVRSVAVMRLLADSVDGVVHRISCQPIGKIARFIPLHTRKKIYSSLRNHISTMLKKEVPGIVESLNIKQIVTEKIDSLDVLRLEKLLLSIMEEQFKYINLFGALLGGLIGCGNLLIFYLLEWL